MSAAFLMPLIGTDPVSGRPPLTRNVSRGPAAPVYSQWNGLASAMTAPILGAASDPRVASARQRGYGGAHCSMEARARGKVDRLGEAPRALALPRAAPPGPPRGRSPLAMSAVSAITTTLSGRTCTNPPTMAKYSSEPPLRIRSSPTPSVESSGAWCGSTPSWPRFPYRPLARYYSVFLPMAYATDAGVRGSKTPAPMTSPTSATSASAPATRTCRSI